MAGEYLKDISGIDTQDWDLLKLALALKMVCCPEEKIAAARRRLKDDAPKYKKKIFKTPCLVVYNEMHRARELRRPKRHMKLSKSMKLLVIMKVVLMGRIFILVPPTLAPNGALKRYTHISSHPLHRTKNPGILCIDIDPSKDIVATGVLIPSELNFNEFGVDNKYIAAGSMDRNLRIFGLRNSQLATQ
uniref:Pre-mRNA-processing factor 19 n=1 Tax=Leersia perrieri TaxID=77586 RepID=A0A0D9XIQ7_9ORYZ